LAAKQAAISLIPPYCLWPKHGGIRRYQQGGWPKGILIVETVIHAAKGFTTVLQNGKQIAVNHWVIALSHSGKRPGDIKCNDLAVATVLS